MRTSSSSPSFGAGTQATGTSTSSSSSSMGAGSVTTAVASSSASASGFFSGNASPCPPGGLAFEAPSFFGSSATLSFVKQPDPADLVSFDSSSYSPEELNALERDLSGNTHFELDFDPTGPSPLKVSEEEVDKIFQDAKLFNLLSPVRGPGGSAK